MADRALPFELVTFARSPRIDALLQHRPDDQLSLYADGVPKGFVTARYRALPSLSTTENSAGQPVVKFGSTLDGWTVLDPRNGEIGELIGRTGVPLFVNSTLRTFTATVRQVSATFPFYPDDATPEQVNAAVDTIRKLIKEIDGRAIDAQDSYWSSFVDDMSIGDWATGAVLDLVSDGY